MEWVNTLHKVDYIWDKAFKNGPCKICGRQPLKKFEEIWSASNFLKAVFHKFWSILEYFVSFIYILQLTHTRTDTRIKYNIK